MSGSELILVERIDHVVVITINRPQRRNAFDLATAQAMEAAVDEFEADPQLRVAVLTGAGGSFSAGQDMKAAARGEIARTERRGGCGIMLEPPTKPVIAAVEGHALGGGLELCLACDLIVAARDAKMGLPEASRAVPAMGGGLFRLPRRIPYHRAMEVALTGKPLTAEQFHELGLVNRLAEPGQSLAVAMELAQDIAANGPVAVAASAAVVRRSQDWEDRQSWDLQVPLIEPVLESEDFKEGLAAFAEKRTPVWRGR
ncbi:crotonase/enoyl-CoA hydratase family protein [[Mycobacterium] burgundiense]|uniref:Crotonase/enoyl-CoA hydratase family protein n=1 Tax=[Mycobacterium] burgundiense TaxID=3064286 RepID=A0ABM9LUJ3_9MYCO|nr:crotonase/enoyl-CoA hydratase family protein [Mycolicibacterium sp. MU0053]CAJ1504947.1 crotonase/enoyl-CoA hydratase family protein [Mycolicibacterium sp. MU0053]